jgi:hypothetical protein
LISPCDLLGHAVEAADDAAPLEEVAGTAFGELGHREADALGDLLVPEPEFEQRPGDRATHGQGQRFDHPAPLGRALRIRREAYRYVSVLTRFRR